ncbi:MAG: hypothetical protein IPG07_15750 [Crocinitomicaceae bacterium]|nr:hypothetical protein [Crocinitomicaceae bacterium]
MTNITSRFDNSADPCEMEQRSRQFNQAFPIYLIGIFTLYFFNSCEDAFESKVSSHNSQGSHNVGLNCMECHSKGGEGEGVFNIAGTVYQQDTLLIFPNTTIELYTGLHGTGKLKYTLEGDAYGNFYSTKNIRYGDGLFPAIKGINGTTYMADRITTGACNSCHGVTTDLLTTF